MNGSLIHHKEDTWHYTIIDHYIHTDTGKKPVRKKFTIIAKGKTPAQKKKSAEDQAAEIWRCFKAGDRFWEASEITLGEYLDRFLADGVKKDVNGNSRWKRQGYIWYERRIRCHIKPRLGAYKLSKITKRMIDDFLIEVSSAGKFIPSHCYSVLKASWQQMIYDGDVGIKENLINMVKPPNKPIVNNPVWSVEQVKVFLNAVKHYRYHLVYLMAFTTGMRINEILGLRWRDIYLEGKTLKVNNKIEKAGLNPELGTPKTQRSVREIKIIPKLILELKRHKKNQAEEKTNALAASVYVDYGEDFSDLVFAKTTGGPVDHDYLRKREFAPAIKACQQNEKTWIPYIAIRDLRHSAATYLLDIGTPLEIVAEILGHSTTAITRKFYVKDNVNRQDSVVEKIAKDF